MPNYCHNTLTLDGDPDELRRFAQAAQTGEQPLSFAALAPVPAEVRDAERQAEWREEHWGTASEAWFDEPAAAMGGEDAQVSGPAGLLALNDTLTYAFLTAWSPPEGVCRTASEQFPELRFTLTYAEPGNDFAGRLVCVAGVAVEQEELEVEQVLAPEDCWF